MWSELCEETEVEKERRVGKERKKKKKQKVGLPSRREKKSNPWNEKQRACLLTVSHEILPSSNLYPTKRALALEVLSRRDLHYERSLMKEWLRGA